MRPSNELGQVGIINTLAECKVILDALEDPNFDMPPVGLTWEDHENSIGVRFRLQTMREPRTPKADAFVELVFRTSPEFIVEPQDIDFVMGAARRVVEEKEPRQWLFNRITKRTEAARAILSFFE